MLGPLAVRADDGALVEVAGARLRTLLIVLALEPGRVVPTARLVDGIWGESPPARAVNAVQALVSRLRRVVPIESHPAGYQVVVETDVTQFERLVTAARSASDDEAAQILREALGLWRGPALMDVAESFAASTARLEELRLTALEDRIEADFRLGGIDLTDELSALVAEHPLRERLVGALMRALCAAGRPAEALTVYERARKALAETLGADPSPELSALHTSVLRGNGDKRTNLRAALTSFVGREADVAQVGKLVGEYRLTTLTGPGGSGKTRLATETARTVTGQLPDGVWLVELASVADVPKAVMTALGLRDLIELRHREMLLVLDNCEHVIDAAAALADRLLGECPRLRILATSREPLGITGEALWPVEPLTSSAAVRLLCDRARAVRPGFVMSEPVTRICHALDGMPLAIELAAARLRTMTAEQLAGRLDDRFRLLTGGSRTALPRHQTLRAVVDWSWDLLSDPERALLRRLAIFSGGATAEAAQRVCSAGEDLLTGLIDKSLLVSDGTRYRMLETIREYGLQRLDEAGEREQLRQAHAAYFAEFTETADPHLRRAEQRLWMDRFAADQDNIHAALRGAIAAGDAQTAVRLVAASGWYWCLTWWLGGHKAAGVDLAEEALAMQGADDETRATAYAICSLFDVNGNGDERRGADWLAAAQRLAKRRAHPVLRLIEPLGGLLWGTNLRGTDAQADASGDDDPWVRAMARIVRAGTLLNAGQPQEAEFALALREFRAIGERWGMSSALTSLAGLAAWRGDLAAAVSYFEQAVAVVTEIVDSKDVWQIRLQLAHVRWLHGDKDGSAAAIAEIERDTNVPDALVALAYTKSAIARWAGDPGTARLELARAEALSRDMATNWLFRAMVASSRGYLNDSGDDHADALAWALRANNAPMIAQILVGVADSALRQGKPHEAARLLAAGEAVRGMPDLSNPDVKRLTAATRAALSERDFAEATRRGQDATIATVRELTLGDAG
jgi:pentatricopeptide repeat protein